MAKAVKGEPAPVEPEEVTEPGSSDDGPPADEVTAEAEEAVVNEIAVLEAQTSDLSVYDANGRMLPPPQMGYEYVVKTGKFGFYIKMGKGLGEQIVDGDCAEFILAGPQVDNKSLYDEALQKFVCQARNGVVNSWITEPKASSCAKCEYNAWVGPHGNQRKAACRMSDGRMSQCRDTLAIPMIYVGKRNDPEAPFELCYLIVSTKGLSPWRVFQNQFVKGVQASRFKSAKAPVKEAHKVVLAVTLGKVTSNGNTFAVPSFSVVGDTNDPNCLHPALYKRSMELQVKYAKMVEQYGIPDEVDGDDITANSNNRDRQAATSGDRPRNEGNPPGVNDDDMDF